MYGTIAAISLVPEAWAARAKLKSADSGMKLASRLMDMLGMADTEQNLTYLECAKFSVLIPVWRSYFLGAAAHRHAVQPAVNTSLFPLALALFNRLIFRQLPLFFIRSLSNKGRPTAVSQGKQRLRSLRGGLAVR